MSSQMELPGGEDFSDVTQLFVEAAEDMTIDELIMARGFTLNEAMSAVEIGDPRMDSGAARIENEGRSKFDPLAPLLPEEICYILDRALACEMHWHAGNALAQTVLTCRYVHHVKELNALHKTAGLDGGTPHLPLLSLALRAGIVGLLKCCDLSYRELVKGQVLDSEDWQGEKSNVSLLEGWPAQDVLLIMEEAEKWLAHDYNNDFPFREELFLRLNLRDILIRLLSLDLPLKSPFIVPLIAEARRLLSKMRSRPIHISPNSVAYSAFDPLITRELHSIMPLRPLEIPDQEESWKSLAALLNGWELVYQLSGCESLLEWNVVSLMQASDAIKAPKRFPFMRSLTQTVFSSGSSVMERFNISWLIDRFFFEIAHVPFTLLLSVFDETPPSAPIFEEFHSTICRLLIQHIWSYYQNRPRHRRHSMKVALDWHSLYNVAIQLCSRPASNQTSAYILKCMPLAILHWRALIIRDIILSGFELDLYTDEERVFAYWYLSKALGVHESNVRELLGIVPESTPAHKYLATQLDHILLLRDMSLGCFQLLASPSKLDPVRRWTNFTVRYKWLLSNSYVNIQTPDPFLPLYDLFLKDESSLLNADSSSSEERRKEAKACFERALEHSVRLGSSAERDESLRLCRVKFLENVGGIMKCCEELIGYVTSERENECSDLKEFEWDIAVCPWFPRLSSCSRSSQPIQSVPTVEIPAN